MNIPENFDRWMFDYLEGNLSPSEVEEFENFLVQHPEYEIDADAWEQAVVQSEDVVYPHAQQLEKKRRVAGWYTWSAAAMLLLLIGSTTIYVLYDQPGKPDLSNDGEFQSTLHSSVLNAASQTTEARAMFAGLRSPSRQSLLMASNTVPVGGNPTWNDLPVQAGVETGPSTGAVAKETVGINVVGGGSVSGLVDDEAYKLNGGPNSARYLGNPESKSLAFDVSKKSSVKYGSLSSKVKKVYRKVERMLDYPVGLTNLRDPELLLPQSNLLSFNTAFVGGMLKPRFEMNYRNQWLGSDMNSQELNISYDNYIYGMRGGVGILVNAQDYGYGKFGDYNMSLLYSPKFVAGRNVVIEPSVKLTLGALNANGDELTPDSAFEMDRGRPVQTFSDEAMNGTSRLWYKDYGLGVMVNTSWFYAGFSADNLNRHYENVYGTDLSSPSNSPVKLSAVIGTDYVSSTRKMTFSPFVAFQQYGDRPELWAGMSYQLNWLLVGASASTHKELTASVGMKFEKFKLVYHYDVTESVVMNDYIGSHNIGILFNAKRTNQRLAN